MPAYSSPSLGSSVDTSTRQGPPGAGAVSSSGIEAPFGGDLRVLEAELLAHVDEGGAPQGEQQDGGGAGAILRAVARAVARIVVVGQHPRGPRSPGIELLDDAIDPVAPGTRLPGGEERRKV